MPKCNVIFESSEEIYGTDWENNAVFRKGNCKLESQVVDKLVQDISLRGFDYVNKHKVFTSSVVPDKIKSNKIIYIALFGKII